MLMLPLDMISTNTNNDVNDVDGFMCVHCKKIFKREKTYIDHMCKMKKRKIQSETVHGQAAFNFYSMWLKSKKVSNVNHETFMNSNYFNVFFEFAEWKSKVKLPNINHYIRMMNVWKLDPKDWSDTQTYSRYMETSDHTRSVEDHIRDSMNTIKNIVIDTETDKKYFLNCINPYELGDYVRTRRISPWFLLQTTYFAEWYSKLNSEQIKYLGQIIRAKFWKQFLSEHEEDTNFIKQFIEQSGM